MHNPSSNHYTHDLEIVLPFTGFYQSLIDSEIAACIDRTAEYRTDYDDEGNGRTYTSDDARNEAISEAISQIYAATSFAAIRQAIARRIVDIWNNEHLPCHADGTPFLTFKDIDSPREYNFTNDRIICGIADDFARVLAGYALKNPKILDEVITDLFTERSGFIPFYSNQLSIWRVKCHAVAYDHDFDKLDANELHTLLLVWCIGHNIVWEKIETEEIFDYGNQPLSELIDNMLG